ncbi:MAG: TonB-dependent receptor, partial [Pseudomonadota bacterium]|nr:TonB-dependent receptor [Pseudomonadota bacterium]
MRTGHVGADSDDPTGTAAEFRDTHVNRYVAEVDYDLPGGFALKSVTAMSDTEVQIWSPAGSVFDRDDTRDARDISQDLQLTFEPAGSGLSGVIGLFFGRFRTDLDSVIATDQLAPAGIPVAYFQELDARNETTNYAIYADARYALTERWTLMAGGRLLHEEVSADFRGRALDVGATQAAIGECAVAGCTPQAVYGSLDEKSSAENVVFLPKVGAAFDVTPDHTVGLTASRGYRAGFSEAVAGTGAINEVAPEYLWAYELAWRSRWLDDRLEVNANAFWYDYENQQILTSNPAFPGQTVTENGARSHAYGLEVDARWQVAPGFQVFGALGLMRTEFDAGVTSAGALKGKSYPEAPAATASLGASWRHASGVFA